MYPKFYSLFIMSTIFRKISIENPMLHFSKQLISICFVQKVHIFFGVCFTGSGGALHGLGGPRSTRKN